MPETKSMDDIVALCKRRGFIYPASEIYGGINGFWDYGPLGIQLKNNIRDDWWRNTVESPPIGPDGHPLQIVGLDSSIIQHPRTWEASGHVAGFNDPMIDCRECNARFRADQMWTVRFGDFEDGDAAGAAADDSAIAVAVLADNEADALSPAVRKIGDKLCRKAKVKNGGAAAVPDLGLPMERYACGACGAAGSLTEPRQFNLMFESHAGAVKDDSSKVYLRPETAQGIFLNFKNVMDTMRVKMPFGIAQIGKAFRNEVTPRNFIFRSREFEQMEMEWFCHEDESQKWFDFWKQQRMRWWRNLGISADTLVFRDHDEDELAHYSKACVDVEYRYPFTAPGHGELEGIAHRGCFDLTQHQEHAKVKLEYFDQERNERYLPNVIEPASGLSRGTLVLLCEAYTPDDSRPSKLFMKFHPRLAPITAAVFPLVNKDGMPEVAEKLYLDLRRRFAAQFDVKQNIGKRYARMDEAGTPFCFTIDGDTLADQTVTARDRDTQQQQRVAIDQVGAFLDEKMAAAGADLS
ncbi:MAG: glycine--tRNA ligase [Phycisphaeraceae bacterium]|nr:glycine--tRNA ligase [Phycisphaeraceae bacterium]